MLWYFQFKIIQKYVLFYQKNAYKNAVIIQTEKAEILKAGEVLKSFLVITIHFGSS